MPVATSSSFVFFSLDEAGVCDLFFDDESSDARGTMVVLLVLGTRIIIARVLRLLLLLPLFLSLVVYFLRYKKIGGRIFKIQKIRALFKRKKEDMRARVPFAFALFSCSAFFLSSSDARLYGSYSRTGGTRKPSGVRFSSRLAYNAYGRKLLQEERGTLQEMQNFVEPVASCPENNTMYNVLKTTPELSR
jgi:hypothetical protein|tara:strand:+ start:100 stop:669 length:570 start_codon:yes stop_codon:yes gene_type:complete